MDYEELVSKVIELLQRGKRVPYRVLKRRFDSGHHTEWNELSDRATAPRELRNPMPRNSP